MNRYRPTYEPRDGLSRDQVEAELATIGVCDNSKQVRALTRADIDHLASINAKFLRAAKPTCQGLPLSGFAFAEHIDLSRLNWESAQLRGSNLPYANFDGASLLHADFAGCFLPHASFKQASLHDADLTNIWANDVTFRDAALFRANLTGADLRSADCSGVKAHDCLLVDATMWRAIFTNAELYGADLTRTDCWAANFTGAALAGAQLHGTIMKAAVLRATSFGNLSRENGTWVIARLDGIILDDAEWGPELIGPEEAEGRYKPAGIVYRNLKDVHQRAGLYEVADEFAFREQVVARKQAFLDKRWPSLIARWAAELLFGYGYRWTRVVAACVVTFLLFTLLYWLGGLYGSPGWSQLWRSAYFSAVSFSGIGYGPWISDSSSMLKYLGALEAPCGVSLMALLLLTVGRRFTR